MDDKNHVKIDVTLMSYGAVCMWAKHTRLKRFKGIFQPKLKLGYHSIIMFFCEDILKYVYALGKNNILLLNNIFYT